MNFSEEDIRGLLHNVIDPEVGLNIVDLGLIYGIELSEDGAIKVNMTLTTRGCPMESYMRDEVQRVLGSLEGVRAVDVEIVWDPPWSPNLIRPGALDAR